MQIFHWVANELKDVDLFSTEIQKDDVRTGAAYNFNNETPFSSDDEEIYPATPLLPVEMPIKALPDEEAVTDSQIVFYDIKDFDTSDFPDQVYRKRVYNVLKNQFEIGITEEILNVFRSTKKTTEKIPIRFTTAD